MNVKETHWSETGSIVTVEMYFAELIELRDVLKRTVDSIEESQHEFIDTISFCRAYVDAFEYLERIDNVRADAKSRIKNKGK